MHTVLNSFDTNTLLAAAYFISSRKFLKALQRHTGNPWLTGHGGLNQILKEIPAEETHYKYLVLNPAKERTW
jgi:hypothetical protein